MKLLSGIGLVALLGALVWGLTYNNLAMSKFFNPKFEQVRRETFEQSKAYNQGMTQELENMRFQYVQASPEHKAALAAIILHRAADYPVEKMPVDLRNFIQSLKQY